jgi:hypothetical protein
LSAADVQRIKQKSEELKKTLLKLEETSDSLDQEIWEKEMAYARRHEQVLYISASADLFVSRLLGKSLLCLIVNLIKALLSNAVKYNQTKNTAKHMDGQILAKKRNSRKEPFKSSKIPKFDREMLYSLAKFANFLCFCITCGNCYHFEPKVVIQ